MDSHVADMITRRREAIALLRRARANGESRAVADFRKIVEGWDRLLSGLGVAADGAPSAAQAVNDRRSPAPDPSPQKEPNIDETREVSAGRIERIEEREHRDDLNASVRISPSADEDETSVVVERLED